MGPLILVFLFVVNLMTSPGEWWVQWAALGIGFAWVINLFRVLRAIAVIGGLAGLAALMPPPRLHSLVDGRDLAIELLLVDLLQDLAHPRPR
jgi:hypothetical protein